MADLQRAADAAVLQVAIEHEGGGEANPARDQLCALWIDRAPRFGAVAAHFLESLQKRRFVASFWAPEVLLFGDRYLAGYTRHQIDVLHARWASCTGRSSRFWAPEVLLFGWWYLGLGMGRRHGQRGGVLCGNTRAGLDVGFSGAIEIAGEPCHPGCLPPRKHLPFWSPELPEVSAYVHECRHWATTFWYRGAWNAVTLVLLLLVLALPAGAQTLFGVVSKVTDGDTLVVGEARVRLFGIDAPEGKQECQDAKGQAYRCGDSAEAFLARLAPVGSSISCGIKDVDRYGRLVAVCSVASRAGSDLGRELVLAGWAVAYRKFSDRYVAEEIAARNARRGLWAGSFQQPEKWRHGH